MFARFAWPAASHEKLPIFGQPSGLKNLIFDSKGSLARFPQGSIGPQSNDWIDLLLRLVRDGEQWAQSGRKW